MAWVSKCQGLVMFTTRIVYMYHPCIDHCSREGKGCMQISCSTELPLVAWWKREAWLRRPIVCFADTHPTFSTNQASQISSLCVRHSSRRGSHSSSRSAPACQPWRRPRRKTDGSPSRWLTGLPCRLLSKSRRWVVERSIGIEKKFVSCNSQKENSLVKT